MKHDRMRSIKIVDELMNFCFKAGAANVHVDVQDEGEETRIQIQGSMVHVQPEEIEMLKRLLDAPRQEQVEGYYWELTGESEQHQELTLVGMMIDQAEVDHDSQGLSITVYRRKQ